MIDIDSVEVSEILQNTKQQYKPQTKPVQEELSKELCSHEIPFCDCIKCQWEESGETTYHSFARKYFKRFSEPLRIKSWQARELSDDLLQRRKKEIQRFGGRIVQSSMAGDIDTVLYWLDHSFEDFPSDDELVLIQYLTDLIFNGKTEVKLNHDQDFELRQMRKHVYRCQVRGLIGLLDYSDRESFRGNL